MNIEELYKIFLQHPSVETDTRKLKAGDIFFALKGPNFNGNDYASQALQAGAAFCVCNEAKKSYDERIVLVEDVLSTLQQLAKFHREQFKIPVIAITGSNGKTTTKELIHEVLSSSFRTYTTVGNLNNHIGIPLTILRIKSDAEIVVIEMGANHQKEIKGYCQYTLPTHGLITNCGKAHIEGFGSEEGVRKAKRELFDYLRKNGGVAFVNNDYSYLKEMSRGIEKIITYGHQDADVTGKILNQDGFLEISLTNVDKIHSVNTKLIGDYNLPNLLAAVCIGRTFNVSAEKIKSALENYNPGNSRSQLVEKDSNKIILDAYNANPSSMKAAIENFAKMPGDNKMLILGGMMELGDTSKAEHNAVIKLISLYKWQEVVLVGKDYENHHDSYVYFTNINEAKEWFENHKFQKTQILIKGSRGMQMEKLLD